MANPTPRGPNSNTRRTAGAAGAAGAARKPTGKVAPKAGAGARPTSKVAGPAGPAGPTGKVPAKATGKVKSTSRFGANIGRPAPQLPEKGNKVYLIGFFTVVGGALALLVIVNIMGQGKPDPVKDRFASGGTVQSNGGPAAPDRTRARNMAAAKNGPSQNRQGMGRSGAEDPDIMSRIANYRGPVGMRGYDLTDVGNRVGDPVEILTAYLEGQRERQQIDRYDQAGDTEVDNEGQRMRRVFFIVEPYDLLQGERKKGDKQLLRGVFVPSDSGVEAMQKQMDDIREQMSQAADDEMRQSLELQLQDIQRAMQEMEGGSWTLIDFGVVTPADPEYQRYMAGR